MGIFDSLINLISGLGTSKDKSTHARFAYNLLDPGEIENAYQFNWLTKKIIDIPPADLTREWRHWQAEKDQIQAIEETEKRLDVQRKLTRAMQLARLDGGCALYIGIDGQDPEEELDPTTVTADQLAYLHLIRRYDLKPEELDRDIRSPTFGQPSSYLFGGQLEQLRIHPSRIIRFLGVQPIDPLRQADGWGMSIMQHIYEAVKNSQLTSQGSAAMVDEMKIDVITVPNLSRELSTVEGTQRVTDRFAHANMMKSMFNMVLMGDGEEWSRKDFQFNGLPLLIQTFLQIAAGAADIPVTRLLGQSPAGMNATGESDTRNYYDMLKSIQAGDLTPTISPLDEIIIRSALGDRPDEIFYNWAPLWQMTATEKATNAKTKAETTKIYADLNLFEPEVIQKAAYNQLVEDGVYPGIEGVVDEYGLDVPEPENIANNPNDPLGQQQQAVNQRLQQTAADAGRRDVSDATPKTLYISRKVLNAADIIDWAHSQGLETTLPASDMHVTIAFSREPVDWLKVGNDLWDNETGEFTVPPGGPRIMEKFGDALVLIFGSDRLTWRHMDIRRAGASWDHQDYNPHITLTYKAPEGLDLSKIEPYNGQIRLGREDFAEINEDWKGGISEV